MAWQLHPKLDCDFFEERVGVWKDVVRFISQPKKYPDKPSIPLWSFYSLTNRTDRERAKDGVHWRACSANMEELNALQIDYDSGVMTIDQFVTDHSGLVYGLYTSPSHTDEHEKFRVVVPLKTPILNAFLAKGRIREMLLAMFPECDKTTINTFRKQRMPAVPLSGANYRFVIGEGERMSLDMAELARLFSIAEENESISETVNMGEIHEDDIFDTPIAALDTVRELRRLMRKYAEELPILKATPRGGGTVHASLTRMVAALSMAGMGRIDMVEFFEKYGFSDTETKRIIKWSTR